MLRARRQPVVIRPSVIVPATIQHERHLSELLTALERQTLKPVDVSISISECSRVPHDLRRRAESSGLDVRIKTERGIAYAGRNRNLAAENSSGNVLVYQDADDLPHPQRLEVVARLFGGYEIDHLMHAFHHALAPRAWHSWERGRFNVRSAGSSAFYMGYGSDCAHPFHNGNNATSRALFTQVRWPEHLRRGQDVAYNRSVSSTRFAGRMARLPWQLVCYRQYLSSIAPARSVEAR